MLTQTERITLETGIKMAERFELAKVQRPALWYEPHPGQVAYHLAPHVVRAMFPGNGFGKTRAAGTEVNWWVRHCHPFQPTPKWPTIVLWGCEAYKQFDILRAQLESECFDRGWSFNGSDNVYTWPGGDQLFLISYDADWTNIQGVNPDLVVFDEEPPHKLWKEMRMRRRGRRKTKFTFAATATKGITWMHDEIYKGWLDHHIAAGMNEDQAIAAQTHPRIWCLPKGGLEDNPGADADDRDWYQSQVYSSEAERHVRLFGGFADFSGTPVFDVEGLNRQRVNLKDGETGRLIVKVPRRPNPVQSGFHLPPEYEWVGDGPEQFGRVTIFQHPKRLVGGDIGSKYVIGFDSALGLATGDFDYAVVRDRNTGEQVAEAQGRWGDVRWVEILAALYWYYGRAFLLGERQVGLPVMRRLYDEKGCIHQYFNRDDSTPGRRPSDKLGHHRMAGDTTIPNLRRAIGGRDHAGSLVPCPITVRSKELFRQYGRFQFRPRSSTKDVNEVHDDQLSVGAPSGDHDDGVFADCYAYMALREVNRFVEPAEPRYKPGTAGHALGHREIFDPEPKGPFERSR